MKKQSILDSLPPVLRQSLAPLAGYFSKNNIIEVCVNRPGEIWIENYDGWQRVKDSGLTLSRLNSFCRDIATYKGQAFSKEVPLLATQIPGYGYRLQAVGGSVTEFDIALSIRVGASRKFSIESYFPEVIPSSQDNLDDEDEWEKLLDNEPELIKRMMHVGRAVLVSGGTNSGKTSFSNSLLQYIPDNQRIIIIEDTQETLVEHSNYVRLLKSKTSSDIAKITYKQLINATMRLRPDRIIMSEIDIENALPFLRLINTGHSGCMATIHANSPIDAIKALTQNIKLSGVGNTSTEDIEDYINQAIDMIIQIYKADNYTRYAKVHHIKRG